MTYKSLIMTLTWLLIINIPYIYLSDYIFFILKMFKSLYFYNDALKTYLLILESYLYF